MSEKILRLENITMQFGGVIAVNNMNLEVGEGEIVSLIGPNGAGKTTAFNVITGVYQPTNGAVWYRGEKIVENYPQGKMAKSYSGQNAALYTAHPDLEDPEALAEEFSDSLYSSEVALEQMGSTVNSEYSEWAYDSARRPGDITLVEYAGGSSESYNYCVALFHDRVRDDAPTADVRHILIGAADANITPTEEQYEQAKAKAEELLAQWEAGDATEDSFAQLAQENSADTSSASNGGLLQYVSPYSGYVDTFTQWSLDPSRQPGDTGIIQNTGSSVKGYHIMYFAGWDDPVWAVSAKNALNKEQYSQWAEKLASACTVTRGSGLKYVE